MVSSLKINKLKYITGNLRALEIAKVSFEHVKLKAEKVFFSSF